MSIRWGATYQQC